MWKQYLLVGIYKSIHINYVGTSVPKWDKTTMSLAPVALNTGTTPSSVLEITLMLGLHFQFCGLTAQQSILKHKNRLIITKEGFQKFSISLGPKKTNPGKKIHIFFNWLSLIRKKSITWQKNSFFFNFALKFWRLLIFWFNFSLFH